jgi:hypothetical protein
MFQYFGFYISVSLAWFVHLRVHLQSYFIALLCSNLSPVLSQLEHIRGTDGVLYYPLFYVNEHGTVNQNLKNQIESAALIPLAGITDGGWALTGVLGLSSLIVVIGSVACCVYAVLLHHRTRRGWKHGWVREVGRHSSLGSIQENTPLLTSPGALELSLSSSISKEFN